MTHVPWAHDLAHRLLADSLPRRWAHAQGVASKAESIAHLVGDQAATLVGAAWLHDVGYAPALDKTGFHPLDGARFLRDVEKVDELLCRLVAHHSCATIEARNRGLAEELVAEFPPLEGLLLDTLTYCDMTTSPDGEPIDVGVRLSEIDSRYGPGDVVQRSMAEAAPLVRETVAKIQDRLKAS